MSEHKRNKSGLHKKISLIFNGVLNQQNVGVHKPCGAPEQQRAVGTEPELPAPEPQVPQTAKPQMKRTFQQHGLFARFNKRKAKAMAKAEEKIRAAVERKVKAETEKMLLTQHRRYSVLAERVMAQAKEEIAAAKAQVKEKLAKAKEQIKAEALARAKAEESLEAEREERHRDENQAKDEIAAAKTPTEEKLAKAEEKARTEALARAKAEESLKAEREERQRVEAQAKEAIAAAKAEAEEKIRSYAAALAQAEEKLTKAEEKAKTQAMASAKAEKGLLVSAKAETAAGKAESKERQRAEAQAKEAIAAAKAQAEEKIRSYAAALAQAEEKLTKAEEKAKTEALARAEAEEKLLVSAKAEDAAGKAESEKRQSLEAQVKEAIAAAKAEEETEEKVRSYAVALTQAEEKLAEAKEKSKTEAKLAEAIDTFKRILQHIFHPAPKGVPKRSAIKGKFVLISALVILSTIVFAVIALKDPPAAESSNATTQEEIPVPITLIGSDPDGEQLTYNVVTGQFHGSLSEPSPSMTYTPTLNHNGPDNSVFRVNDGNSIPASDTQSSTITVNPAPPKIATLTVLDGYNQKNKKTLSADGKTNIVQYSDDERWETGFGSYTSYDFSDASIPAGVAITSVVVFVEHFEEERFAQGKLEWAVGTGWPTKPVVWAVINAPVHEGQSHEAIDAWDVTNIVDTREKINSLQLQVKNNNNVINRKTLIDYVYVVVEWD